MIGPGSGARADSGGSGGGSAARVWSGAGSSGDATAVAATVGNTRARASASGSGRARPTASRVDVVGPRARGPAWAPIVDCKLRVRSRGAVRSSCCCRPCRRRCLRRGRGRGRGRHRRRRRHSSSSSNRRRLATRTAALKHARRAEPGAATDLGCGRGQRVLRVGASVPFSCSALMGRGALPRHPRAVSSGGGGTVTNAVGCTLWCDQGPVDVFDPHHTLQARLEVELPLLPLPHPFPGRFVFELGLPHPFEMLLPHPFPGLHPRHEISSVCVVDRQPPLAGSAGGWSGSQHHRVCGGARGSLTFRTDCERGSCQAHPCSTAAAAENAKYSRLRITRNSGIDPPAYSEDPARPLVSGAGGAAEGATQTLQSGQVAWIRNQRARLSAWNSCPHCRSHG